MSKLPDEIIQTSSSQLLKNCDFFHKISENIISQAKNYQLCLRQRLLSNYIFMLMKDLTKVYKVYHLIVQEILERFPTLKKDQCQDAYRVY